ncbi:hypothetical protein [Microbacterium sp. NPDC096154]|uniref:PilN domain-containing protein n=1 Tax=Microbacterium sp. NPDC096154 TaxID=3155549 RepID=UPI003320475D
MSLDESRPIGFSLDPRIPDDAPVSARSTSTQSIPIVTDEIGAQPGENRRARRARLGASGEVPVVQPQAPDVVGIDDLLAPGAASEVDAPAPAPAKKVKKAKKAAEDRPHKTSGQPKAPKGTRAGTPSAPKPKRNADQLPIGGVPRVDLLPPELKEARAWRQARGRSLILLLCAALMVLAGVAGATAWARVNIDARDAAQARTDELLSLQSQFTEVNAVQGGINAAEQALTQAGATDVLWATVLDDLRATLPSQARVTSLTIEAPSPGAPLAAPTDVLQSGERAATVTFTALTAEVPDVSAWVRAVERIEGVTFVSPRASTTLEDEPGYTVEMAFDLSTERLRTPPEADEGATEDGAAGDDAEEGTP